MTYREVMEELRACANDRYKSNVVKMGIPENGCIGVSTGDVRALAKKIGKSDDLAGELWKSGVHEARLLAALLFDAKKISDAEITALMNDVVLWDLCDHLCKNLIVKRKDYDVLIGKWIDSDKIYCKRAAFTLIAACAVHDKNVSEEKLDTYLQWIRQYSSDPREHVKKAVSWALREIGKIDFSYNEKAVLLAHEWKECGDKTQKSIAADALKELETVVQVAGRKRLISSQMQMGRQEADKRK